MAFFLIGLNEKPRSRKGGNKVTKIRSGLRFAKEFFLKLGWERARRIGDRTYEVGACLVSPPTGTEREPWMDAVYGAALDLGPGSVVDVGVNRMQTLFKVLRLDASRRYVGFEPQLQAALAARDFVSRNGLGNIEIVCAGLSDAPGIAELRLHSLEGFDAAASIAEHRPESFHCGQMTIPLLRGDDVFERMGLDDVRLINADVEEAELEVLSGLRRVLSQTGPVVTFEVLNDWRDPVGNPEAEEISQMRTERALILGDLLKQAGMRIFSIRPAGLVRIESIERQVSSDLSLCNYVAVPEKDVEAFEGHFATRAAFCA